MSTNGWIGVDLDGTLAHYDGWKGVEHIGEPIAPMVERVKGWLSAGREVRIFTARIYREFQLALGEVVRAEDAIEAPIVRNTIEAWSLKHIGQVLPITCCKDFGMIELWDDRCVRVLANSGQPCCG